MRDIQMVLERWGAWAANNHENVSWSPIAAGFKGLIPSKVKFRPQCCDDDGLIISSVMAVLKKKEPYQYHALTGNVLCIWDHITSVRGENGDIA